MALFNEIQVGRYNAILHKLFSMKEGAPAPQLSGDIVPSVVLENDRPEWAFLGGERLMVGHADLAASAGNVNNFQLWNPAGSGVLVICEKIYVGVGTIKTVYMSWSNVALTTNSVAGARDARLSIAVQVGAGQVRYQNSPAPLGTGSIVKMKMGDGYPSTFDNAFVIDPGHGLIVSNTVQNSPTNVNFVYRERTLEPSELR